MIITTNQHFFESLTMIKLFRFKTSTGITAIPADSITMIHSIYPSCLIAVELGEADPDLLDSNSASIIRTTLFDEALYSPEMAGTLISRWERALNADYDHSTAEGEEESKITSYQHFSDGSTRQASPSGKIDYSIPPVRKPKEKVQTDPLGLFSTLAPKPEGADNEPE